MFINSRFSLGSNRESTEKLHANFKEIEFSQLNLSCFPLKYAATVDIRIAFTKQFIFFLLSKTEINVKKVLYKEIKYYKSHEIFNLNEDFCA